MTDQVPDLKAMRRAEVLWLLRDSIVFRDLDLIAFNKPYGLICQGTPGVSRKEPVLFELLKELADVLFKGENQHVEVPKLFPCHRLDKEVTGVLLMATSRDMARTVQGLIKEEKVDKTYYALTKSVPQPSQGMIDIPMEEGTVGNMQRMVLRPHLEEEYRRLVKPSAQARRAVTYYKTRSTQGNAAFLEVNPQTGVKHQIRAHLGLGLRCPIIGDHKYTYVDRIVPQKLPEDILTKLNVRQAKARNVPMHLHAKLMVIPEIGRNGNNVFIQASLPPHFRDTCSRLGLKR
jgi:23S rRNA-/tRNA-specific pseudouridylate synthase